MIPWRNTNDVVYTCINPFHQPTTGPTGAQNHHSGLVRFLGGPKSGYRWSHRIAGGCEVAERERSWCEFGGGSVGEPGQILEPVHLTVIVIWVVC
ncbi:hypothetical protein Hanom_Chr11g01017161 [Helianthus anomalus]